MTAGLNRSMARGAAWMVAFKLLERSLGLVSTLILLRLLAPEDFGIVAMAMSFIAMAALLSAFGFDLALIQNQQAAREHYDSAWTSNLLLGVLITVVMVLAAGPIARFYDRADVYWVVCALALGPTLQGLENIGVVAFRKELEFRKEFRFLLTKKLIGVLITVPLAFWLRSYWALVIGALSGHAGGTLLSYRLHPFRPRPSLAKLPELMRFSRWIMANSVTAFLRERTSDFLIGSMQGPRALGLFNVTNEFANLPHTELAAPVNRALIPTFAKTELTGSAVHAPFIAAFALLAVIVVPSAAIVHAVAPYLVPALLGTKWLDGIALMQVLPFAGGLAALQSLMCALLIGKGRPGGVAGSQLAYVALLIAGLLALMPRFGLLGAAYAVLAAAILSMPVFMLQLRRHMGVRLRDVAAVLLRPLLAAALAAVAVDWLMPPADPTAGSLANLVPLLQATLAGVAAYAAALFALWRLSGRPAGAEQVLLDQARHLLWRLRSRPAQ